jgi:hypothetical protein
MKYLRKFALAFTIITVVGIGVARGGDSNNPPAPCPVDTECQQQQETAAPIFTSHSDESSGTNELSATFIKAALDLFVAVGAAV